MKKNETKEDQYITDVAEFAVYVNREDKIVGIYNDPEDALVAEKSFALKKLKNLYKYHIQMVDKSLHNGTK